MFRPSASPIHPAANAPITVTSMNVVPGEAKRMFHLLRDQRDLAAAREVYYGAILPLVDLMFATRNPTGTIKAGLRVRGIDVGVPRPPGSDVAAEAIASLQSMLT